MRDLTRRHAIKSALSRVAVIALGTTHLPLKANQNNKVHSDEDSGVRELVNALRALENEVCDTAATTIEQSHKAGEPLTLHLRDAGLTLSSALTLAEALNKHSKTNNAAFHSFSVSYNQELGDPGVIALAKSLPQTIQEIGFVDCNFGDEGGKAILEWAKSAPNLKMICIEGNNLTKGTLSVFHKFKQTNPEVMLFL